MNIHLHTQVTLESLSVLLRTSIRHAKLYLILRKNTDEKWLAANIPRMM